MQHINKYHYKMYIRKNVHTTTHIYIYMYVYIINKLELSITLYYSTIIYKYQNYKTRPGITYHTDIELHTIIMISSTYSDFSNQDAVLNISILIS